MTLEDFHKLYDISRCDVCGKPSVRFIDESGLVNKDNKIILEENSGHVLFYTNKPSLYKGQIEFYYDQFSSWCRFMEPVFIDINVRVCGGEQVIAKWKDTSAYTKVLLKENTEDIRYTRKWMEKNFMTSDEECGLDIFLAPFEKGQKRLADSKWTDFVSIDEETGDIVINHHVMGEPKEMP